MKRLLMVTFLFIFMFGGLAYAQEAEEPVLPDDTAMLELIENECLLNLRLIQLSVQNLQLQGANLMQQERDWNEKLERVQEKIKAVNRAIELKLEEERHEEETK